METTYSWEDTENGGTRMSLRNHGQPSGFSRLTAPMLGGRHAPRQPHGTLSRLKAVLGR